MAALVVCLGHPARLAALAAVAAVAAQVRLAARPQAAKATLAVQATYLTVIQAAAVAARGLRAAMRPGHRLAQAALAQPLLSRELALAEAAAVAAVKFTTLLRLLAALGAGEMAVHPPLTPPQGAPTRAVAAVAAEITSLHVLARLAARA